MRAAASQTLSRFVSPLSGRRLLCPSRGMATSTVDVPVPAGFQACNNIFDWYEANKELFKPPICNKLMWKDQLTVMFVGGPNTRTDFHLEEGSEFFYQLKGNIELPTIQQGKLKVVKIREGEVFLLPSRIPHSPQRPEEGSFGLVVERRREEGEMDGLRWYVDFSKCDEILYEKFFRCEDLGKDLVPVVKEFKESQEFKSGVPAGNVLAEQQRPLKQDYATDVPAPFSMASFLSSNAEKLAQGLELPLFGDSHPDKEFKVVVAGGPSEQAARSWKHETWLYQLKGSSDVKVADSKVTLSEGCCVTVEAGKSFEVSRPTGSITLTVQVDPRGNLSDR